jgi:hypothetical protein
VTLGTVQAGEWVVDTTNRALAVMGKTILKRNAFAVARVLSALQLVQDHRVRIGAARATDRATEAVRVGHYCRPARWAI